jgi:hypothetical protein
MVRELRALGLTVHAADLCAYPDSLVPDIATGVDVFDLKSLAGYRFVTNLPCRAQDAILAHLLQIATRDGCHVAVLARSEWSSAKARRTLVHKNPRFAGEVRLTKRPVWVRPPIASPRHWFSWFVWSPKPRASDRDPFLRFAGSNNEGQDGQNGQDRRVLSRNDPALRSSVSRHSRRSEAARLPQPKSVFPRPTVGLQTEEWTMTESSTPNARSGVLA